MHRAESSRPTFQIGRQMENYRAEKRTDTGQIPLAVEELEAKAR